MIASIEKSDLIVFSHLRWDFVYQRPQHLLSRFAQHRRVFFFEEPMISEVKMPRLHTRQAREGVLVVVPHLPLEMANRNHNAVLSELVDDLIFDENIHHYSTWHNTPMALPFTRSLSPEVVMFDIMDELSLFKGAPTALIELEEELMQKADLVFTGGHSLFEAKKHRHSNIHAFPSSIDYKHFAQARQPIVEPEDQASIPHPRIGFFGVIDERMDMDLLRQMALLRPNYQFVIIGPVVKIDPASLPSFPNIHYLGKKSYHELPSYLAHWDCAIMPFAMNDSTRFISPTKTPEFLAAGKPVVSTPIKDVVRPYGEMNLVEIANNAINFVVGIDKAMRNRKNDPRWLEKVDQFLSNNSWDITWREMAQLEYKTKSEKMANYTKMQRLYWPRDITLYSLGGRQ